MKPHHLQRQVDSLVVPMSEETHTEDFDPDTESLIIRGLSDYATQTYETRAHLVSQVKRLGMPMTQL